MLKACPLAKIREQDLRSPLQLSEGRLAARPVSTILTGEYSSADITLDHAGLREMLAPYLQALPAELRA